MERLGMLVQVLLVHCNNIPKICSHHFTIHYIDFYSRNWVIFAGLAENSCQKWTALAKKETLNSFLLNRAQNHFFI
jgi:hypothetical protein